MSEKTLIFGKLGWPYTDKAREDFKDAVFYNVKEDPEKMDEMLNYSKGTRLVPVIVKDGEVSVGHGGTWGV